MVFIMESTNGVDSFMFYRTDEDNGTSHGYIDDDFVLTQSRDILEHYKLNNKNCELLNEYLGLPCELGLYEIFSYYFEGKVNSDMDMLSAIFKGLLSDSDYCFCLKIGVSFCWFRVSDRNVIKLGTMQFSEPLSYYTVGRFMKRLRYNIVMSGINLNRIRYLLWDADDLSVEFSKYIVKYDYLSVFFSKIEGLAGVDCVGVMKLLSKNLQLRYTVSAESFVNALSDSFSTLGLHEKDGVLYSRNVYYKDYSVCRSSIIDKSKCSWGIILDCEGKLGLNGSPKNGCREIGGLIYCRYENLILNLEQFSCDEVLLEDTLLTVLHNLKVYSGKSTKSVKILTFGKTDKVMLLSSLQENCSNASYKSLQSKLNFIDVKDYITGYLYENGISIEGRNTLTNIARVMGVLPITPKHSSISDARTLFNVLAKILQETNNFI